MGIEQVEAVTTAQLVGWIQDERVRAGNLAIAEQVLIKKAALDSYCENLELLQQDIQRLAKGIVYERSQSQGVAA